MKILSLAVLSLLVLLSSTQYLILTNTPELSKLMGLKNNSVKVKASPIGFKPILGSLHGKLALASPSSACSQIQTFQDQQQDIFVLADDLGCVQSIKAHNIASSGAYIGIIKRNINNTLHDKQIDLVHIPILEMEPIDYDLIVNHMNKNPNKEISTLADFNPPIQDSKQNKKQLRKVKLQIWLSPNQKEAYDYISQLASFIINQPEGIQFRPHFVFQAQASKKQYVGCFSSGRYCPPQLQFQGRPQGTKVVSEALRQIIIAAKDTTKWLNYAAYYTTRCLGLSRNNLWTEQNSELCSQNVMLSTQIDPLQIAKQYNNSFQGPRPEVDGNTYLEQQHQLYLGKKLTQFPTILVNNKAYQFQQPSKLMLRICNTYNPNPRKQTQQCQKITNKQVFTWTEVIYMIMVLTCFVVMLTTICKRVMKARMRSEIRGDVNNTLAQYYRYMETFEQPNPVVLNYQRNQPQQKQEMQNDTKNKSTQDQDLQMTQYKK